MFDLTVRMKLWLKTLDKAHLYFLVKQIHLKEIKFVFHFNLFYYNPLLQEIYNKSKN